MCWRNHHLRLVSSVHAWVHSCHFWPSGACPFLEVILGLTLGNSSTPPCALNSFVLRLINNLKRVFTKGESQLSVCRARLQSSNFGCISSHKLFYMNFTSVSLHLFLFLTLCLFLRVYPLFHLLNCCSGYPTVLDILCCCAACQEREIIFFNVCPTTIILPSENRWIC